MMRMICTDAMINDMLILLSESPQRWYGIERSKLTVFASVCSLQETVRLRALLECIVNGASL
jgi:hypothetical protein